MKTPPAPSRDEVVRSVARLMDDPERVSDLLGAQLSGSELAGTWWRPTSGVGRAERRRGGGPGQPLRVAGAYARVLERADDDRALAALRVLQVGTDPEWKETVAAAADRLAGRGRREPGWWPPVHERVGRCIDVPWALQDGRFDVLAIEVFQGAQPIGLAVVVDHEGTISDVLVTDEMAGLLEIPADHGGALDGDPRWRTPRELGRRIDAAIDRTDLLGVAAPPRFLPGTGYPALRALLRSWVRLAAETGAPVGSPAAP